jgi:hypothetical protein
MIMFDSYQILSDHRLEGGLFVLSRTSIVSMETRKVEIKQSYRYLEARIQIATAPLVFFQQDHTSPLVYGSPSLGIHSFL